MYKVHEAYAGPKQSVEVEGHHNTPRPIKILQVAINFAA